MEIKFWDKILKEYTDNDYYVNSLGEAVELYGGMDATLERCEYIEPHFYLNGKRVAYENKMFGNRNFTHRNYEKEAEIQKKRVESSYQYRLSNDLQC